VGWSSLSSIATSPSTAAGSSLPANAAQVLTRIVPPVRRKVFLAAGLAAHVWWERRRMRQNRNINGYALHAETGATEETLTPPGPEQ